MKNTLSVSIGREEEIFQKDLSEWNSKKMKQFYIYRVLVVIYVYKYIMYTL
jgi:hypothetical protein